jgi:hypothetical protein
MCCEQKKFRVVRKKARYALRFEDCSEDVPVKVLLARPLSDGGETISFVNDKKKEVAMICSLDSLDSESRTITEEALAFRYLMAKIVRVKQTKVHFGTRYLEVETDLGQRKFAMRDPSSNAMMVSDDRLVLRDTHGNLFAIESMSGLDRHSRQEIEKVM